MCTCRALLFILLYVQQGGDIFMTSVCCMLEYMFAVVTESVQHYDSSVGSTPILSRGLAVWRCFVLFYHA